MYKRFADGYKKDDEKVKERVERFMNDKDIEKLSRHYLIERIAKIINNCNI